MGSVGLAREGNRDCQLAFFRNELCPPVRPAGGSDNSRAGNVPGARIETIETIETGLKRLKRLKPIER
jgi:hypothetical protein